MEKRIAKVHKVSLGIEDHGIFGFNIDFQTGTGVYQGTGWYSLSNRTDVIEELIRFFTPYGDWNDIKHRIVFLLYADDQWGSKILGFESLPFEPGGARVLMLEELFETEEEA